MNINVPNFINVLRKATLNNSIESVQLNFEDGKIKTKMITENRDGIIFLEVEDDVLGITDELTLNFSQPAQQLLPFLNIIEEENAEITVQQSKIIIQSGQQKSNIHFCSPTIVSVFSSTPREIPYFLEMEIDDTFIDAFKKIKKIGSRFGKIYFNVDNKTFNIETTDKTNTFSNGLKFDLTEVDKDNLTMCFDFKNFTNLMTVINGDASNFILKFAYIEEQEKGALVAEKTDSSEKYFLMSKEE